MGWVLQESQWRTGKDGILEAAPGFGGPLIERVSMSPARARTAFNSPSASWRGYAENRYNGVGPRATAWRAKRNQKARVACVW